MIRSRAAIHRLGRHQPSTVSVAKFGSFEGNREIIGKQIKDSGNGQSKTHTGHNRARKRQDSLPRGDWKSVEYQGAAAHGGKFQRLASFVEELELPTDDNLLAEKSLQLPTSSLINEALSYFSSYKATAYASKHMQKDMPDVPKLCTQKLLAFLEYQYRTNEKAKGEWIQNCIGYRESPFFGLLASSDLFLRPLKGTKYSIRVFGARQQRQKDMKVEEALNALKEATRVRNFMVELIEDTACPRLVHDWNEFLVVLALWKTRCGFLGGFVRESVNLSPGDIQEAFEGVRTAQECIEIMTKNIESVDAKLSPSQRESSYTMLLGAVANSGMTGAAAKAMEVLRMFEGKQQPSNSNIYSTLMLSFAKEAKHDKTAVHQAQQLWNHILAKMKPDPVAATTLLMAYSNARMPEEVEKLLVTYEQTAASNHMKPTRIDYNIAVNSWAKSDFPDSTERALTIFRRMVELSDSGENTNASPDVITYTALIEAFARNPSTGSEGLDQAEYLLEHAENSEDPSVKPDAILYRNYMTALTVRFKLQDQKTDIAHRIEKLLHRMRKKSKTLPASVASQWHNPKFYGTAIYSWSKAKSPEAPKRGLQLFQELKKEGQDLATLRPDVFIFHALLACLGTRVRRVAGISERQAHFIITQARKIIKEMDQDGFPVTTETMNLYFKVLMSSGLPQGVEEAERSLESLEKALSSGKSNLVPDSFSYQIVMEGYSKIPGGAEHAERMLQKMVSLSAERPSLELNAAFFNIVMDAWGRSRRDDAVEQAARVMKEGEKYGFQPTVYNYTTLMNVLAHSGRDDAPEAAEALLGQMQSDFESGRNPHCRITEASISAIIKCWELSGKPEGPDRIDSIVKRLKDFDVDLNYSSLKHAVLAWMKITNSRPDAGDRAIKYLDLVDEGCERGQLEVFHALHIYNAVLVTIARSRDGEKAGKAYDVLKRLEHNHYLRARDYRAVLSACNETGVLEEASQEEKSEAFRIANVIFLEFVESKLRPDEEVYTEMFRVHTRLLDGDESQQERERLLAAIFTNSPDKIQQSPKVRAALRPALSAAKYEEIFNVDDKLA